MATVVWVLVVLVVAVVHSQAAVPQFPSAASRFRRDYGQGRLPIWLTEEAGIEDESGSVSKRKEEAVPLSLNDVLRVAGVKRKVFWQPLGYLPASARIASHAQSFNSAPHRVENAHVGSPVFRYG